MFFNRKLIIASSIAVLIGFASIDRISTVSAQTDDGQDDSFKLFDGQTLDGWIQRGGKAKYEVVDGVIVGSSVPNTPNSFLCTEKDYGDFELQLEFKVDPQLNSGVQIRSQSLEHYKNGQVHGYQVEIDPSDRAWSGGVYDEGRRGWIANLKSNRDGRYAFKQNDWNHFRIMAIGDHFQTWLNGVKCVDFTDAKTAKGFIALQVHGVGGRTDPLTVRWRNIRILEMTSDNDPRRSIRKLIPRATAMTRADFTELTTSATPSIDSIKDKSLTLMLLGCEITAGDDESAKDAFSYADGGYPNPAEIAKEISSGGLGTATMIHQKRITDFTCTVDDDRASGECTFVVPELFHGKFNYSARLNDNQEWEIYELAVPARGIHITLGEDGKWKTSDSAKPESLPVFNENAKVKKLADGFKFTEGPALGPDGKIYFNDIPNSVTHVFDPETKDLTEFRTESGRANGLFWSPNDALYACEGGSRQLTRIYGEQRQVLAEEYDGKKLNSPNDLVLDSVGGCYFTDPRYGDRSNMELDVEGVYYVARNRKISRVIDDFKRPNGIIMSPDYKKLYVADQADGKIWSYDVVGDGKLDNKTKFADFGSDGMSVDSNGNIYLTWDGAIIIVSPDGQEIARLETPESPANCLLVGSTLYITARTGFYSVETNTIGIQ